jgi:hypothetical protein
VLLTLDPLAEVLLGAQVLLQDGDAFLETSHGDVALPIIVWYSVRHIFQCRENVVLYVN